MIVPPELSWTHLLPTGLSYAPSERVGPLAEALQALGGDRRRRILVMANARHGAFPSLDAFHGLAALNCTGVKTEALRASGFDYVRRFAMLPRADRLRWLIPLDNAAVSAGALQLYGAVRATARAKHAVARSAARARLPIWYRDELLIACRETSPLESGLASVVGDQGVRLAISSGAPGPLARRKPSVAVVGQNGALLAVAKLAVSPVSEAMARQESSVLETLEAKMPSVRAPRVMFGGTLNGTYTLVQSAVHGRAPGTDLTDAHRRFLATLRLPERRPLPASDWGRALQRRVTSQRPDDPVLSHLFAAVQDALAAEALPAAVVHGDFAPWNLREQDGKLAAYDWENATIDGVAFVDEIHHRLVVGHLMHDWSAERAMRDIEALADSHRGRPEPAVVKAIAGACVLDFCLRLIEHGHTETDPIMIWYRELAARLQATIAVPA